MRCDVARSDYYISIGCDLSLAEEEQREDWRRQIEFILAQVPDEDKESVREELEASFLSDKIDAPFISLHTDDVEARLSEREDEEML